MLIRAMDSSSYRVFRSPFGNRLTASRSAPTPRGTRAEGQPLWNTPFWGVEGQL